MAVVLLTSPNETEGRNEAFTIDLSPKGCRIEGSASLLQGQLVRLIPSESPEIEIQARVVWVGEPASDLAGEAGMEFLQPLPPPV